MSMGPKGGIKGAEKVKGPEPFDKETNFVDLHLDFPVYVGKYVMGMTPYMRALDMIGGTKMDLHGARLQALVSDGERHGVFRTLLKLYAKGKKTPFKSNVERVFSINVTSDLPQDFNAALYKLIARVMWPFEYPGMNAEAVESHQEMLRQIREAHGPACLEKFVDEVVENRFLKNLQHDCLEIYPKIIDIQLPLRAALFLDLVTGYEAGQTSMRVSRSRFDDVKDLFKDISEIISRLFVLIAGLNNLHKRGDHNAFKPGIGGTTKEGKDLTPKTLNDYANVDFGKKIGFVDDPWHELLDGAVSNRLRNAIAHYKAEYNEIDQIITYFPTREGMSQEKSEKVSFLDFLRWVLMAYREMHRMHHLVKVLFYYRYLMQKKGE